MQKFPTEQLKEWFLQNRRPLPWRDQPTPYRVWISEMMLQQTQVAVVIPYFEKWMAVFPTLKDLAKASLDFVLKCWEGLGYYSRARQIHHAARFIVEHHLGEIPSTYEELSKIKGIGAYTQGAIRAFAFKQKTAAVDGNVLRLLSRFLALDQEIDQSSVKRELHVYVEEMLPDDEPWLIVEGLIELGAMVCGKKAHCSVCPLRQQCLARKHNLQSVLPKKRKACKTIPLKRSVAVIGYQGRFLVRRGEAKKVMADLYEFPYLECSQESQNDLICSFEAMLGLKLRYVESLPRQVHTFTRYRAQLFPHYLEAQVLSKDHEWKNLEELKSLPFSSGHKRVLESFTSGSL